MPDAPPFQPDRVATAGYQIIPDGDDIRIVYRQVDVGILGVCAAIPVGAFAGLCVLGVAAILWSPPFPTLVYLLSLAAAAGAGVRYYKWVNAGRGGTKTAIVSREFVIAEDRRYDNWRINSFMVGQPAVNAGQAFKLFTLGASSFILSVALYILPVLLWFGLAPLAIRELTSGIYFDYGEEQGVLVRNVGSRRASAILADLESVRARHFFLR
ncbi:hypothetical protein [Nitrospirillum sp. BR 11163]|uniref:hypothetical protein n=1 Tax=Nitrospirillum sp. BR 11163 TaxID=3104323 RepID=UPI002AFFE8E2|nr:hypothetical protein [Nitrospirillum sp. BR 11163]MEA1675484.1 hypothetical protein [Nitrospirillum sp. BR 11163]